MNCSVLSLIVIGLPADFILACHCLDSGEYHLIGFVVFPCGELAVSEILGFLFSLSPIQLFSLLG